MYLTSNLYLDFIKSVNNEHVDQVLPGAVQPVVEWGCALGKLQVEAVNTLQDLGEKNTMFSMVGPDIQHITG